MKNTANLQIMKPASDILFTELQTLRGTEQKLDRLYRQLGTKPQLRQRFLDQLADLQNRVERLDSLLGSSSNGSPSSASGQYGGLVA